MDPGVITTPICASQVDEVIRVIKKQIGAGLPHAPSGLWTPARWPGTYIRLTAHHG